MRLSIKTYYYIIAVLVIVFGVCFMMTNFSQTVAAQDGILTKGLTLSPLRTEIDVAPGVSLKGELTVTNSTNKRMVVSMSASEFKVIDQQYNYSFDAESDVAKWVSFNPSESILKAGESKKISYTIGVPLTAEPGGYYISMFASTTVFEAGDTGNSQQRVASLLYITVSSDVLGAVTNAGHVLSLTSPWLVVDKGTWGVTIQNGGTAHYRSDYSVKVEDLFGGQVGQDKNSALILPNTIRALSGELILPSVPGIYKITYTIGLGDSPSVTQTHYMLFLTPWALLLIITIIILAGYQLLRRLSKPKSS